MPYPDDWKSLPVPDVPTKQQKPVVAVVDRILAAKKRHSADDLSALETELDDLVFALYQLTPEQIAAAKTAPTSSGKKHTAAKGEKAGTATPKKKARTKRKANLPPSLPGWD